MRSNLFLFFAQTRFFWRARAAISRLVFFIHRILFGIRHRVQEESTKTRSLLSLLRFVLGDLFVAILIAFGLQITNSYFVTLFTEMGFALPKESFYGTLLATFTSIGGIFIGFYYAAISAVCGAIYAKVPNNIRDLLAQERVGNAYMRFLAVFTSLGVCLLTFYALGLEPIILTMPLLLLGAGLMIIGFVRLGARAFHLFDPTTLSGSLFKQLQQCYLQMQAGGYRWSDQSFQNHAHRVAQNAIYTLTTVSDIAAKEPHLNGRPFADLCKNLLLFLCHYEIIKKSIPTDSLWYKKRYVHQDWYRTGDTETSIGHDTATGLQPQSASDPRWIESAILPIVQRCLEINIQDNRHAIVYEILDHIDTYVKLLAREHQVEPAFDLMSNIFSWCGKLIITKEDKVVSEEPLEYMAIFDKLARMPISVLIAYAHATESYGLDVIIQRIQRISWKSEKSIYGVEFPVHVLAQLEWLRTRLEFEERIEQSVVSPPWYLQELIAQKEAENLHAATVYFYEKICKLYGNWIKTSMSSQHPWLAAVIISVESEYWSKLNYNMNTLNQFWVDLNSSRRIEGLSWPSLNIDELRKKEGLREKELLELMARENIILSSMSRSESYPDFAGQFLHTIGEALFTAICENDCDTVETLFKRYFYGSSLQFERLRPEEVELDSQSQIDLKIAVAPLLDLMDISGYTYLFSDYHDTPRLKETITMVWDEYIDQNTKRIQFLAGAVLLTESAFESAHRSINRTRWKQIIQQRLEDVEHQEVTRSRDIPLIGSEVVIMHKSPLVRIFAKDRPFLPFDGIDIFLAKYVRQRENGKDLDFGRRRSRNVEEAIERENDRYTEVERS